MGNLGKSIYVWVITQIGEWQDNLCEKTDFLQIIFYI